MSKITDLFGSSALESATLKKLLEGKSLSPIEMLKSMFGEDLHISIASSLGVSRGVATPSIQLEGMFDKINADQFKLIAGRYNPTAMRTRVTDSKKSIQDALKSPKLLTAMLEKLSDLERHALDFICINGGSVSGWVLIAELARQNFNAPKTSSSASFYRQELSSQLGIGLIGSLLHEGLVLPYSSSASWFKRSYYYSYAAPMPEDDVLYMDARVLAALQKLPSPAARVAPLLNIEAAKGQPISVHPAKTLLELSEIMNLILEDGLVSTTKDGSISKPMLNKYSKRRPWLADRIEFYLSNIRALGFLVQFSDGLKPNITTWSAFQKQPLELRYAQIIGNYTGQNQNNQVTGIKSVETARQGLMACLPLLPDHPMLLEPALKAMHQRVLRYFSGENRDSYSYSQPTLAASTTVPAFFKTEMLTTLPELGLIALETRGSKEKPEYLIAQGSGITWLENASESKNNPPASKPSLLVQPNFDVLVYLDQLSPVAILALSCADCQRIDAQTAMYTISRASVYRALETGLSVEAILEMLTLSSSTPLPSNVRSSIGEWSGRRERLSLTEKTILLEYHDSKERDAALKKSVDAQAIGERFMLVKTIPKSTTVHHYSGTPNRTIVFQADGTFKLEGGSDLAARAMISNLATPVKAGVYTLNRLAVKAGGFNPSYRDAFSARVKGNIPRHFEALLTLWEGKIGKPNLVPTTLFQHELATALATHPSLEPLLAAQLNNTTYLVKAGSEKPLEQALKALGIETGAALREDLKAAESQGLNPLQTGLDTRKMRMIIEKAIEQGRNLELHYDDEKTIQSRYGYPEKMRGKPKHERIAPSAIVYSASTPYFNGETLDKKEKRTIRIGYIHGIGII